MKHVVALVLVIYLCPFNVCAREADGKLVRFVDHDKDTGRRFYFSLGDLVSSPRWDPSEQSFPINFPAEIARSKNEIGMAERLTEPLRLGGHITISRISWHPQNTNIAGAPDLADKWVMTFFFYSKSNHVLGFPVKMLMNGACASTIEVDDLRSSGLTNELVKSISRFSPVIADISIAGMSSKILENKPEFKYPKEKWDPESGNPLPLDLQAEVMRGRDFVAAKYSLTNTSLSLKEIDLVNGIHENDPESKGTNRPNSMLNWIAEFEYVVDADLGKQSFWVYKTLDGTIIYESEGDFYVDLRRYSPAPDVHLQPVIREHDAGR